MPCRDHRCMAADALPFLVVQHPDVSLFFHPRFQGRDAVKSRDLSVGCSGEGSRRHREFSVVSGTNSRRLGCPARAVIPCRVREDCRPEAPVYCGAGAAELAPRDGCLRGSSSFTRTESGDPQEHRKRASDSDAHERRDNEGPEALSAVVAEEFSELVPIFCSRLEGPCWRG